ncbi:MAG: hypothetical protein CVU39_08700 [Chloroflexi bacterium HGW-Chloroflexi-10]|nr:MAG: hypothetical protein CVU39_08700 [Chloroflexi bacterium HGW-Chloroflexi-10]
METSQTFQTKEEYAYQALRKAIIHCDLKPGDKLVIDRLSVDLGISQIPIRSAMQRLQAEGLVVITPHSGAVVAELPPEKVDEIFALLAALEQVALRLTAGAAHAADLDALATLIGSMDAAAQQGDAEGWLTGNIRFHRKIAEMSGMPLLMEFTNRTLDEWERLSHCYFPRVASERMLQAQAEHREMLSYLRSGEIDRLVILTGTHNRHAHENYRRLLKEETI